MQNRHGSGIIGENPYIAAFDARRRILTKRAVSSTPVEGVRAWLSPAYRIAWVFALFAMLVKRRQGMSEWKQCLLHHPLFYCTRLPATWQSWQPPSCTHFCQFNHKETPEALIPTLHPHQTSSPSPFDPEARRTTDSNSVSRKPIGALAILIVFIQSLWI